MQIKFFKIKKSFKKGGIGSSPDLFWEILLVLTFFIILASFIFGFLLFMQINKESIFPENNVDKKSQVISKERIEKTLQYFSNKENKSTDILNSPTPITDPAL